MYILYIYHTLYIYYIYTLYIYFIYILYIYTDLKMFLQKSSYTNFLNKNDKTC